MVGNPGAPSVAFQAEFTDAQFKMRFSFFRGADGTLYVDNAGSKLAKETETELGIHHCLGNKYRWQRHDPTEQNPSQIVVTVNQVTTNQVTTNVLASAPPDQAMEREEGVRRLRELKQLLDEGVLTQEEFEAKKAEILQKV